MSSMQENNSGKLKILLFLRKCSIDKIKCSAYPVLGSIFEKKSMLTHAIQNVLRNLKKENSDPMTVLIIPAMQFLCLTMTSTICLIRKHVGGVSTESFEKIIREFNEHKLKSKRSLLKEIKKLNIECNHNNVKGEEKDEKFYDCLTAPATEAISSVVDIKSGRLLKLSYGLCLAVVYSQLTMLMYMVLFCAFKLGFLFLLACVATIAYFVLKISFLKKSNHGHGRKAKRHSRAPSAHQNGKAIALILPQIRLNSSEKLPSSDGEGKQKLL